MGRNQINKKKNKQTKKQVKGFEENIYMTESFRYRFFSGPSALIIATATVLLALSALGAALLIRHKRKLVHEYKTLVQEIQS